MPWSNPSTVSAGSVLTASRYNQDVVANTIAGHPLVTTLPASPTDGDTIYYQTAAMATLGLVWTLRYRSGGGTYKWEFVGGDPLYAKANGGVTATTNVHTQKTGGPSFAIPAAGEYLMTYGATAQAAVTANYAGVALFINAVLVDADTEIVTGTTNFQSICGSYDATFATAGHTLELYYKSDSGTSTFIRRWLRAVPIRVG